MTYFLIGMLGSAVVVLMVAVVRLQARVSRLEENQLRSYVRVLEQVESLATAADKQHRGLFNLSMAIASYVLPPEVANKLPRDW